jgi:ABC-type multidrug transport system permease subunit
MKPASVNPGHMPGKRSWLQTLSSNYSGTLYAYHLYHYCCTLMSLTNSQIMAVFAFFVWYYPIGLYRNANFTDTVASRGFLTFLNLETSFLFASSFGHMLIAGVGSEEVASSIATLLGIMRRFRIKLHSPRQLQLIVLTVYAFCGILSGGPGGLPGFWIFMYRVNPFTYLASSLLSATLGAAPVQCGEEEFQRFLPPSGQTCGAYMQDYINDFGGYMRDPSAQGNESCEYCRMENTNDFLAGVGIDYADRWGDWGILCCYVVVNCTMAFVLYWLARVPKTKRKQRQV